MPEASRIIPERDAPVICAVATGANSASSSTAPRNKFTRPATHAATRAAGLEVAGSFRVCVMLVLILY
jgi:hypothetical protein